MVGIGGNESSRAQNSAATRSKRSSSSFLIRVRIMLDKDAPVSSRLRAAESVVGHAAKAIEIEEIEARVAALEQAADATKLKR